MIRSKSRPSSISSSSSKVIGWCSAISMPTSFMATTANPSRSPLRTPAEEAENVLPNICRNSAAAIGERTEFCPQANSTARGFGSGSLTLSPLPVQDGDEREQPPRGLEIDRNLVLEPLHQQLRALVMQGAAAHVERLDALGRCGADRRVIAVADQEIVLHDPAQRRQRQMMRNDQRVVRAPDVEHQAVSRNAQMQLEGPAWTALRHKRILLQKVVDRDRTFMLDVGTGAADRILVQRHRHQPVGFSAEGSVGGRHRGLKRIATERACASSPSASPSVIAAGPSARNWSGPHLRIDVRFMKSSTPSPEEKRAERAVGST